MTPSDHMSASRPYLPTPATVFRRFSTSGAKYCGVPQKVFSPSRVVRFASPKSVILTSISLVLLISKMLHIGATHPRGHHARARARAFSSAHARRGLPGGGGWKGERVERVQTGARQRTHFSGFRSR